MQANQLYYLRTRHAIIVPKQPYSKLALLHAVRTLQRLYPGEPIRTVPRLHVTFYQHRSVPPLILRRRTQLH